MRRSFAILLLVTCAGQPAFGDRLSGYTGSTSLSELGGKLMGDPHPSGAKTDKEREEEVAKLLQKKAFDDAAAQNGAGGQSCGDGQGQGQGGTPMMPPPSSGGGDNNSKKDDQAQPQPTQPPVAQASPAPTQDVNAIVKAATQDGDAKNQQLQASIDAQKKALDDQNRANQEKLAALDRQRIEDQQKDQENYLAALKQVRTSPAPAPDAVASASTSTTPTGSSGGSVASRQKITIADRLHGTVARGARAAAVPEAYDRAVSEVGAGTRAAGGDGEEVPEDEQVVDKKKLIATKRGATAAKAPTPAPVSRATVVREPSTLELVSPSNLLRAKSTRRTTTALR